MFYQSLENIKTKNYSTEEDDDVKRILENSLTKFDDWLFTLPKRYQHRLNPLQFSNDYRINQELSLKLFYDALNEGLLGIYYEVISDDNIEVLDTFFDIDSFNKTLYSDISDKEVTVSENNVNIWFKIVEEPKDDIRLSDIISKKEQSPPLNIDNIKPELQDYMTELFLRK